MPFISGCHSHWKNKCKLNSFVKRHRSSLIPQRNPWISHQFIAKNPTNQAFYNEYLRYNRGIYENAERTERVVDNNLLNSNIHIIFSRKTIFKLNVSGFQGHPLTAVLQPGAPLRILGPLDSIFTRALLGWGGGCVPLRTDRVRVPLRKSRSGGIPLGRNRDRVPAPR